MIQFSIASEDRIILRELAKKQLGYSQLPIMQERIAQWLNHNEGNGTKPMIHVEIATFEPDIMPKLQCQSETGKKIELGFYRNFINYEQIDDDRVVPPYFPVHWDTWFHLFGAPIEKEHVSSPSGQGVGHRFKHIVADLGSVPEQM
ncbi:MAG: hypothetical protein GX963_09730 [Bacteroidales bacterium]|nr:hypothetical protein [Bacteroidales bacterium]